MNKTLIYLIGFLGSGKFTTAKELCKTIDAVIAPNNIFKNIILSITDFHNAEVPDDLWENIFAIRKNLLAMLEKHYIRPKHYIFTNELVKGNPYDQKIYDSVVHLSKKMQKTLFPVVLHCSGAELIKRIQLKDRHLYNKITDLKSVMERIEGKKLFVPTGALEIDNSSLSAEKVAKKIIENIKGKNLTETSVTTSSNKEHKK